MSEITLSPELEAGAYEFTPHQNAQLTGLVKSMAILYWGLVLGGLAEMLYGLRVVTWFNQYPTEASALAFSLVVATFFAGVVGVICGLILRRATDSFVQIVRTEGADLAHLMAALERLANFFFLSLSLTWVLIVSLFVSLLRTETNFFPWAR